MQASGQLTQQLVLKFVPKVGKVVSKNSLKNQTTKKQKKTHHQTNTKKHSLLLNLLTSDF